MITEKQKSVISMIESNLGIKFNGETKEEAKEFISEQIEQSKKASQQYKIEMLENRLTEMLEREETMEDYFEFGWYNMPH